jgi:cytochrome P450
MKTFSISDVKEIEYLHFFIKEIMRMFPPVSYIPPKLTLVDTMLGEYFIPKGTKIGVNIRGIHNSKEIYGDPEIFRPERWSNENISKISNNSWLPFSIGSRTCVGSNFSIMEQKIFIFELLRNFRIILKDEKK